MNINDLTIGQAKEISEMFGKSSEGCEKSVFIGKNVLIRTYSAGVHYGVLEKKSGTNLLLSNAHRIYSWGGAFTLSEVATKGINSDSRVSCKVNQIELTQAIEIIEMSDIALLECNKNVE